MSLMRRVSTATISRSSTQCSFFIFFFNDTATTEIYTLSLHDALPILAPVAKTPFGSEPQGRRQAPKPRATDRKSTRLNSSHSSISYAVFCLKKKKQKYFRHRPSELTNRLRSCFRIPLLEHALQLNHVR